MLIAFTMVWADRVCGQELFTLGAASTLQTIDIGDQKVVDLVTIVPSMSDIAFHPDGSLYGVNEQSIYRINTSNGQTTVVKTISSSFGWLVGLTIDYHGDFYMSSLSTDEGLVIRYDPTEDKVEDLGTLPWRHWDIEFYEGELYVSGGTDLTDEGFLIRVDRTDFSASKVIIDCGAQAYGLASFNDACGSIAIVAPTFKALQYLDPSGASFNTVQISDALYSTSSGAASRTSYLGSLPPMSIDSVVASGAPCDASGFATAEVFGEINRPGIEYSINGSDYQASAVFEDLAPGTYQISLRDSLGCTIMSDPFKIEVFDPIVIAETSPAHCSQDNGSIQLAGSLLHQYMFSIDGTNFSDQPSFTQLAAGEYVVYISNSAGCLDSVTAVIEIVEQLKHALSTEAEHCEMEDGLIQVVAEGGREPYDYSLVALPAQSSPTFAGLHSGTYVVRTSDALGCWVEDMVKVDSVDGPTVESIVTEAAHCGMADGYAEILTGNHNGNVLLSLNGEPPSSFPEFDQLEPGSYTLLVADEFGCTTDTSFVIGTIDGPVIDQIITTNDNCLSPAGSIEVQASSTAGSLTYSLDGITFGSQPIFDDLAAGQYTLVVMDAFGCATYSDVVVQADIAPEITSVIQSDATCNENNGTILIETNSAPGILFSLDNIDFQSDPLFTDLPPGDYQIFITDDLGCEDMAASTIQALEQSEIVDVLTADASCLNNDGSATVISDDQGSMIQYSIDGSTFQTDPTFVALGSHTYTAYIIDENGCLDSLELFIDGASGFDINDIVVEHAQCGQPTGAIGITTSSEVNLTLNNEVMDPTNLIEGLQAGVYSIVLTDDNHCTRDTTIEIDRVDCGVYVPNAFSPNGDGVNDFLSPSFDQDRYTLTTFSIYDRWGNNVLECSDLCEWDGTSNGDALTPGVYVYMLVLDDVEGGQSTLSGDVTLLR